MMRKAFVVLAALAALLLPQGVLAHGPGQLPFLLVNGRYAGFFPVPYSPSTKLEIPQDSAPQTYKTGQNIDLELDHSRIGLSPYALKHTLFNWEFGDGASGSGLKTSHQFSQAGSYLVKVYTSTDANPDARQLAE